MGNYLEPLPERARYNKAECAEVGNHYNVWVAGITVAECDEQEQAMALVDFLDQWPDTRAALVTEAMERRGY